MRAGTKRRFNPGEIVECTDRFTGDSTAWVHEPFGEWARRNGIPLTRLQSRRSMLGAPRIMLRLPVGASYSDATGPHQHYATGTLCAIRVPVPTRQARGMCDTHLYPRR